MKEYINSKDEKEKFLYNKWNVFYFTLNKKQNLD